MQPPNEDCSADTALKGTFDQRSMDQNRLVPGSVLLSMQPMYFLINCISVQFLRLVHSVCDHHPNKYLLLSRNELEELKHNNNDNPNIDKIIQSNLHCAESEGKSVKISDSKIYENMYRGIPNMTASKCPECDRYE